MGLFGTNGIRGILGETITLENIHEITMSIAEHIGSGPILVGRDGRYTSVPISSMVYSSLCYAGINCADAGLVPTPCLALGVRELGYAGGIMITASHNPPQYGGLKLIWNDGIEASHTDEASIERIYAARSWEPKKPWGAVSTESRMTETYSEQILKHVNVSKIATSGLGISIDIGNGAQASTAKSIAAKLCKSISCIHENIDPEFSGRGSEPTPENLSALSDKVRDSGSDLGIAFDGDGDRSIICDERGTILSGDESALFLADYLFGINPHSDVVTPINSSDSIDEIAARTDSRVTRTRVGSVIVSREMKQIGALVGFEENGGFMYGPHIPVRDGCMTMSLALEAIATQKLCLSEIIAGLPKSFTAKTSVKCTPESASHAIRRLAQDHPDADLRDGVKIRFGTHRWVMARLSGTEPIIRIYAESHSKDTLDSLLAEYSHQIRKYLE